MPAPSKTASLIKTFAEEGLEGMFLDELGWDGSNQKVAKVAIGDASFAPRIVADLKGFRVYEVPCAERPSRLTMRLVDARLREFSPERMEVFQGPDAWFWHWPRPTASGTESFEAVETRPGVLPTFLAQRLTGLEFTPAEHRRGLTLVEVRERVQGRFDASPVTKRFYKDFTDEHENLSSMIEGLPKDDRGEYATTLLNRLMFLYFLQKKEFLNDDPRYLENTLQAIQAAKGQNHFYNFYRDALLPLFFDKLNERRGLVDDQEIERILGDVPYINAGIFGRTDVEVSNGGSITIADDAFESILRFFSRFNWHLDTRPTGNSNEINPEVIGYIFEQYINFTASGKRNNGAYYTAHDVTSHMVGQTLVPRILDDLGGPLGIAPLLVKNPDRYVPAAMRHGWDEVNDAWLPISQELIDAWLGDPSGWTILDESPADPDVQLVAETWVETFHRRGRTESLRRRILAGELTESNHFITDNLDAGLLLTDAIDLVTDPALIVRAFHTVSSLSIIDPTCGSGAFLFAALEALEPVYEHLVDVARHHADSPAVAAILKKVEDQPSTRYFIRKHIAIRNLYGSDLMPGAIETAKLRIFLTLAACVEQRDQLRPLPDLDFNLKAGNLVVGFKDSDDVDRVGSDLFVQAELVNLQPEIEAFAGRYADFVAAVERDDDNLQALKTDLRNAEKRLRENCNRLYAEVTGIPKEDVADWVEHVRPFHWFCEFPEIIRRGGFDVIVGNPPYIKMRQLPGYTAAGYATSGCPDLFAVCYERSLSLLSDAGRHSFIVMAALAQSDRYRPLREVVAARRSAEWWATYGLMPAGLFPPNVRVRNTILSVGPGQLVQGTRHHLFSQDQRPWLMPTTEYSEVSRNSGDAPVRGGVATNILTMMAKLATPRGKPSGKSILFRPTGAYWMPVMPGPAPVLSLELDIVQPVDTRLKRVGLVHDESPRDAVAVAGGSLAYLWWQMIGDNFDLNPSEADVPRALAQLARGSAGWDEAVAAVVAAIRSVTHITKYAGKWYFSVRWTGIRMTTNEVDRLVVSALGGTSDDWRRVGVLYRQMMRSSGEGHRGRYLTDVEYEKYLDWSAL